MSCEGKIRFTALGIANIALAKMMILNCHDIAECTNILMSCCVLLVNHSYFIYFMTIVQVPKTVCCAKVNVKKKLSDKRKT